MNTNCLFFIIRYSCPSNRVPPLFITCVGIRVHINMFCVSLHIHYSHYELPLGGASMVPPKWWIFSASSFCAFAFERGEISALCQHKKPVGKGVGSLFFLKTYPSICPTWVALPRFIGARRRNMTRKPPQRLLPVYRGKILHMPSTYPTVVRVIKAHQNPSKAPLEKHFGNSPEFPLVS